MRLFVALDFDELKDYFVNIQNQIDKELAKVGFPRSFHLTLKFLGEVAEDKVSAIKEELKKIKFEPFSISLDKIGFFPSENYIRVVWIGLKPLDKINELQQKIDNSLISIFTKDKRFHPHLTICRVKFVKDKPKFIENLKKIEIEEKKIDVSKFKLIKSILTREGPVYEDLGVFG